MGIAITLGTLQTTVYGSALGGLAGSVTGVGVGEIIGPRSSVNKEGVAIFMTGLGAVGGAVVGAMDGAFVDNTKSRDV